MKDVLRNCESQSCSDIDLSAKYFDHFGKYFETFTIPKDSLSNIVSLFLL